MLLDKSNLFYVDLRTFGLAKFVSHCFVKLSNQFIW